MLYDLRRDDDPILLTPTEPFDFANPPIDPIELANNMLDTMREHNGVGIAANQCGIPYSVFVMHDGARFRACFNPVIETLEDAEDTLGEEGCLSFPGLFLRVRRKDAIRISYTDEHGGGHMAVLEGVSARIALHETDHLKGVPFTSRVSKLKLSMAEKKRQKIKI